ncbi:MAG: thioredoxin domain-containing protein [Syntrophobacteraceae bacterium]|nr:thioredoxin domain-containing protein [Desulfobacteraceae bacterium]
MQQRTRFIFLLVLSFAGFGIAALTGLVDRFPWLQSFCFSTSSACSDSARFTLFHLPVWLWGGCFYILLIFVLFRLDRLFFWVAAAGLGVEASLVWIMLSRQMFCAFCAANLIVVLAIAAFAFQKSRFWQMSTTALLMLVLSVSWIPYENGPSAAGASNVAEGAAAVGEEAISFDEVEVPLAGPLLDYDKAIYRMKMDRLEQIIMEKVINKEAAQRGVSPENLVNRVILADGVKVDDEEIDRNIEQNLDRYRGWTGPREDLRNRVRAQIEQQKKYEEVVKYSRGLWPKYGVAIHIREPQMRLARVNVEGSQSLGPSDAPVVIVQYSDYQCPVCRDSHETIRKVREAYAGKVRWVFKDYPLRKHLYAHEAAQAARCAGEQNKFWEYQDALYTAKEELKRGQLIKSAEELGLDVERFKQCLESGRYKTAVDRDVEGANKTGITSIPAYIINGKIVVGGYPFERFKEIIDAELKKAEKKL